MAQPRFHAPGANYAVESSPERQFNSAPTPLGKCDWLREKATGHIHPYHPGLAARSDLVEPYTGPLPWESPEEELEQEAVVTPKKRTAKKVAPPTPPAPPLPEAIFDDIDED
ncbi:hypothetical protein V757_11205 [Pelistega indica]|uniref:Uncharacterized protein n=1 Tax=Pelistega indica TaxID=1414851 RepID=V8FTE1_9BURK|nr:hypothetical protein [Pelistega indica]ETD67549.1 hypothetical protein V757_11205 [Pelistega indica]